MIILFIIFLIIVIFLFSNIVLRIKYEKELLIKIKYTFLSIKLDLSADNKKKKIKKPKQKDEAKKENTPQKQTEKKEFIKSTTDFLNLLKQSSSLCLQLFKKTKITNIRIYGKVCSDDAMVTAIKYCAVKNGAAALLAIISSLFNTKIDEVYFAPDFSSDNSEYRAFLDIKVKPITLIIIAIKFITYYSKIKKV